ncbi:MAG TPA: hypothetical protein VJU61_05685 [Polyangiaceae bacterium]|nr:hypothetical protein [Polyangiaceae bacterium]
MNVRVGLICGIAALLVTAQASADDAGLAAECARSFDDRAKSAQRDYRAWLQERAEARAEQKAFEKAGGPKLVEFFDNHCRFLSDLERAIRKIDEPNAIVCNKPKPKGLTLDIVAYGSVEYSEPRLHIAGDAANRRCQASDTAERFSLVFNPDGQDAESLIASQSLLCYADDRPSCKKAMPLVAQLKAKLAAKQAQGAPPSPLAPGG